MSTIVLSILLISGLVYVVFEPQIDTIEEQGTTIVVWYTKLTDRDERDYIVLYDSKWFG